MAVSGNTRSNKSKKYTTKNHPSFIYQEPSLLNTQDKTTSMDINLSPTSFNCGKGTPSNINFKVYEFYLDNQSSPFKWLDACISLCEFNLIKDPITICTLIVNKLPPDIVIKMGDNLKNILKSSKPIVLLRDTLGSFYPTHFESTLEDCFRDHELGDRKPSTFLADLKTKLRNANGVVDLELVKFFFFRSLPLSIKNILLANTELDLNALGILADKLHTQNFPYLNATHSFSLEGTHPIQPSTLDSLLNSFQTLTSEVRQLKLDIADIKSNSQERFIPPNIPTNTFRDSPRFTNNKSSWCFYHQQFGNRAIKCIPPCNFKKNFNLNHASHQG